MNIGVWITIFIVIIFGFPVGVYGETEFWFASLKVFAVIGLLLLSSILFCGGGNPSSVGLPLWKTRILSKRFSRKEMHEECLLLHQR